MRSLLALLTLIALTTPSYAEVPLTGTFTTTDICPAFQSFNNQTNTGQVVIVPDESYDLVAANRDPASAYMIVVPGASPERRWVAAECGSIQAAFSTQPTVSRPTSGPTQYILAVNWQPAFCEANPDRSECESQTRTRFDATHFTLHGLWPQWDAADPTSGVDAYCDLGYDAMIEMDDRPWSRLPEVRLSRALRAELDTVMPGTASLLDRHEWASHGTCYGKPQEGYFADALALMSALNSSPVAELFADTIGRELALDDIRTAFDSAFGPGAGDRVDMACQRDGNRLLITELTIGLTGRINGPASLPGLVQAARPTGSDCDAGIVDHVGLQ